MNAFLQLPTYAVLPELMLPAIPTEQDCTGFDVRLSQVCGIYFVPCESRKPSDWTTQAGWENVIDNADTDKNGRYLVGAGSFTEVETVKVSLGGGRREIGREKKFSLVFQVQNVDPHIDFLKQIEAGYRKCAVWFETVGGQLVGGADGMQPFYGNVTRNYEGGRESRESVVLTLDFWLARIPDSTLNLI